MAYATSREGLERSFWTEDPDVSGSLLPHAAVAHALRTVRVRGALCMQVLLEQGDPQAGGSPEDREGTWAEQGEQQEEQQEQQQQEQPQQPQQPAASVPAGGVQH